MSRAGRQPGPAIFTPVPMAAMARRTLTDESVQWAIDVGKIKPPPRPPRRAAPGQRRR
jgi:hypothetical protein